MVVQAFSARTGYGRLRAGWPASVLPWFIGVRPGKMNTSFRDLTDASCGGYAVAKGWSEKAKSFPFSAEIHTGPLPKEFRALDFFAAQNVLRAVQTRDIISPASRARRASED